MNEDPSLELAGGDQRRSHTRAVLDDLTALEQMISEGMIEEGVRRIGAEQEMFLVDGSWRPALVALELLELLDDPHFTTELGLFNLEINIDPIEFEGDCLRRLGRQLSELMGKVARAGAHIGIHPVLSGTLPSIRQSDLGQESMTPLPRYRMLNEATNQLRGGPYHISLKGLDELELRHESVMLEACNASFQVHFQVGAEEFPRLYNIAQAVAAPVLAASTFSPMLFGKRLWAETRIGLFQQSVDTRLGNAYGERLPRVTFGRRWVEQSAVEVFREDVARFPSLVAAPRREDSREQLGRGEIPDLAALRLHSGTIYRWNRPCYGVSGGVPHLRIENRVLPSGPTVLDEIANAAFWFGAIAGLSDTGEDIRTRLEFDSARLNFHAAARRGLPASFTWLDGQQVPARSLILDTLLPMAQEALVRRGLDRGDVERYLGVIEERVATGRTGSCWLLDSFSALRREGVSGERVCALTASIVRRQQHGSPVAQWPRARLEESGESKHGFSTVSQIMTADLYTVREEDPIDMVQRLMQWHRIRHIPVEDEEGRLVGLVSYRSLQTLMAEGWPRSDDMTVGESGIMRRELITVEPETPTLAALRMMRCSEVGCLPVLERGRLVGIVTGKDLMDIAGALLEKKLGE